LKIRAVMGFRLYLDIYCVATYVFLAGKGVLTRSVRASRLSLAVSAGPFLRAAADVHGISGAYPAIHAESGVTVDVRRRM
jgi:hypothetical protein